MNWAEMIVALVAIGTIGGVLKARWQVAPKDDAAEAARAQDEVRQLKERIQVLERVITDNHGSDDLDREIERLRDR